MTLEIGTVSNMFRGVDIAKMAIGQRLILSTPSSSSPIIYIYIYICIYVFIDQIDQIDQIFGRDQTDHTERHILSF